MRKRMINPSIWSNRKFIRLTPVEKILFVGLISTADDYGKLWNDPLSVKASIFPCDSLTEDDIIAAINKLKELNLIIADDKVIKLHGWKNHQSVPKPSPSSIPEPLLKRSGNSSVSVPYQYSNDSVTVNHSSKTSSAKERKKERKKESNLAFSSVGFEEPTEKAKSIENAKTLLSQNISSFHQSEYLEINKLIDDGKNLQALSKIYEKLDYKNEEI